MDSGLVIAALIAILAVMAALAIWLASKLGSALMDADTERAVSEARSKEIARLTARNKLLEADAEVGRKARQQRIDAARKSAEATARRQAEKAGSQSPVSARKPRSRKG